MNHVLMKAAFEKGLPMLNAHNNPQYLLGELQESEYVPIVVAWDVDDAGMPAAKFMVDEDIEPLMKGLEQNPDVDAWETTIAVNKAIRANNE